MTKRGRDRFLKLEYKTNPAVKDWCDRIVVIRFDPPETMEATFNNLLEEARRNFNEGKSGKSEMDKKQTKGIRPGPSSGIVIVYSVKRNPFGGYIDDEKSRKAIYVHRSAVEEAGLDTLVKGQHMSFDIVEDGVGGFRAVNLKPTE